MYYEEQFKEMIGAKVSKIFFNEDCTSKMLQDVINAIKERK